MELEQGPSKAWVTGSNPVGGAIIYMHEQRNFHNPSFFQALFYIWFVRNPCKKCLVRSCCSEICENKHNYLKYCDIDGNISMNRLSILSVYIYLFAIIIAIIKKFI